MNTTWYKHFILPLAFLLTLGGLAVANDYYTHGGYPATGSAGSSAAMRAELDLITAGFDKLPVFASNANKAVIVNSGATGLTATVGTFALAGNFAITGAFNTTLVQGATTTLTLPLVNGTLATLAGTETLTGKTVNLTSNTLTGTTAQFNTALSDNDFATLAGSETLTNKTLTSPVVNTPTGIVKGDVGLGNVDNTSDVTKNAAAVTLTNKTITAPVLSGTVTGTYTLGGTPTIPSVIQSTIVDAKGDLIGASADDTPVKVTVGADGTVLLARSSASNGLTYAAVLNKQIYGLISFNNGTDNIDINAGGAMDSTGVYWMTGAASTKKTDTAWAVGSAAGCLDTGTVGDHGYYVWIIVRTDTGVVDYLCSLSSTAPTMPANYTFKRLIGWYNRSGGIIDSFTTAETEGGGLEYFWRTTTLDIDLSNTLTSVRRADALHVPLNFSVLATINVSLDDVSTPIAIVYCPDQPDFVPSTTAAPLGNVRMVSAGSEFSTELQVKTSSTGTIAARANLTVDLYRVWTSSFRWARRN